MTNDTQQSSAPSPNFLLELGPLLAFFVALKVKGMFWAIGVLMLTMPVAMALCWKRNRKIPPMMIIGSVAVLAFGAPALYFKDERIFYYKVTVVNFIFALVLFVGVLKGRYFLKSIMGQAMQLTNEGWRGLCLRFACLFTALGILNEIVWRNYVEYWGSFKAFGLIALTMLFMISQLGFIKRVSIPEEPAEEN